MAGNKIIDPAWATPGFRRVCRQAALYRRYTGFVISAISAMIRTDWSAKAFDLVKILYSSKKPFQLLRRAAAFSDNREALWAQRLFVGWTNRRADGRPDYGLRELDGSIQKYQRLCWPNYFDRKTKSSENVVNILRNHWFIVWTRDTRRWLSEWDTEAPVWTHYTLWSIFCDLFTLIPLNLNSQASILSYILCVKISRIF